MIVDSSTNVTNAIMAAFMVTFKMEGLDGDDIALDIIEFIAVRMKHREDYQVAELGYFIRANLLYFQLDQLSYQECHARLVNAAVTAPLGYAFLAKTFEYGARGKAL